MGPKPSGWFAAPTRPAFFRVCASDDRQGAAAAAFAYKQGLRRAFVIDDNESYGRGIADVFANAFPKVGGTLLGREHLTAFALDYKSLLTKIAAQHPDAIFFGGLVARGVRSCGSRWPTSVSAGWRTSAGMVCRARSTCRSRERPPTTRPSLISPDIDRLPAASASAAPQGFGGAPGTYSAGAYAAAQVALAAIRRAWERHPGTPPSRDEVLRAVAATREVPTALWITFDGNGVWSAPPSACTG